MIQLIFTSNNIWYVDLYFTWVPLRTPVTTVQLSDVATSGFFMTMVQFLKSMLISQTWHCVTQFCFGFFLLMASLAGTLKLWSSCAIATSKSLRRPWRMTELQSISTSYFSAMGGFLCIGLWLHAAVPWLANALQTAAVALLTTLAAAAAEGSLADLSDIFPLTFHFSNFAFFCMDSPLTFTNNNLCCVNFWLSESPKGHNRVW